MKRSVPTSSLLLALASALPGCGSLDAHTGTPPTLATLSGQIVSLGGAPPSSGAVRVAVVWGTPDPSGFNVAEDLPVQPVFPSSFSIQLDEPPPASAMFDSSLLFGGATPPGEGTGAFGSDAAAPAPSNPAPPATASSGSQIAIGAVVAYLDKNGNGKLDLVPAGASGYVDQILATNETDVLVYVQGSIPLASPDIRGTPSLGYNQFAHCPATDVAFPNPGSICANTADAGAGAPAPTCTTQWLAINSPMTLTVSSDPQVNDLMCQSSSANSRTVSGGSGIMSVSPTEPPQSGRPATYPAPCDPNLACLPDGSSYTYTTCQTVKGGLCEGTQTSCTNVSYLRPSPVPKDWPCKS